ncbi:IS1-like element transposase [Escherichia coli]|nr:IS1-like element transposase [Escherichia coli]MCZ5672732.1 IS1-like element transposase [Escherichia coli]MCZ5925971.1 IS1-like element transposase [Escherichia coli]
MATAVHLHRFSTAGHQRYLCSHCRKTWQLQFTYTASQPGTHQKIIDIV